MIALISAGRPSTSAPLLASTVAALLDSARPSYDILREWLSDSPAERLKDRAPFDFSWDSLETIRSNIEARRPSRLKDVESDQRGKSNLKTGQERRSRGYDRDTVNQVKKNVERSSSTWLDVGEEDKSWTFVRTRIAAAHSSRFVDNVARRPIGNKRICPPAEPTSWQGKGEERPSGLRVRHEDASAVFFAFWVRGSGRGNRFHDHRAPRSPGHQITVSMSD